MGGTRVPRVVSGVAPDTDSNGTSNLFGRPKTIGRAPT